MHIVRCLSLVRFSARGLVCCQVLSQRMSENDPIPCEINAGDCLLLVCRWRQAPPLAHCVFCNHQASGLRLRSCFPALAGTRACNCATAGRRILGEAHVLHLLLGSMLTMFPCAGGSSTARSATAVQSSSIM
jgi:hypothetical protein